MPLIVPPGVTKRHLDTLISRGQPFVLSGDLVVECRHGRPKRQVTDMEIDLRFAKPQICGCCENLYAAPTDEPAPCPTCTDHLITGGR